MIHTFDYSRYKKSFENCCFRRNVNLIEVNPAYTSKIVEQKYCKTKKLVIHQGASFVIARKGQGFTDKYIKNSIGSSPVHVGLNMGFWGGIQ